MSAGKDHKTIGDFETHPWQGKTRCENCGQELLTRSEMERAKSDTRFLCDECDGVLAKQAGLFTRTAGFDAKLVEEAKTLKPKGYTHVVQIEVYDYMGKTPRLFGEPLFIKGVDAGPLLRSFPSYAKATVKWVYPIDAVIESE